MQTAQHQQMAINWYINMYAFCHQRAAEVPKYRSMFTARMQLYEKMYLQITHPITINQLLQ